ncbi:3765_t:CDS:2 [Paraglomus occultum]|uniref:3765_t:CDS:1 n=1 Tax=Paraglomus occultum TaxID=144539 RepID=A0A9N9BUW1_9GLOM|nr:3765_t:CDS:2 [Paraglomus occultum]
MAANPATTTTPIRILIPQLLSPFGDQPNRNHSHGDSCYNEEHDKLNLLPEYEIKTHYLIPALAWSGLNRRERRNALSSQFLRGQKIISSAVPFIFWRLIGEFVELLPGFSVDIFCVLYISNQSLFNEKVLTLYL